VITIAFEVSFHKNNTLIASTGIHTSTIVIDDKGGTICELLAVDFSTYKYLILSFNTCQRNPNSLVWIILWDPNVDWTFTSARTMSAI